MRQRVTASYWRSYGYLSRVLRSKEKSGKEEVKYYNQKGKNKRHQRHNALVTKPKATFRFSRYVSSPFLHRFTCKSLLPRFHGLRIDLRYSARAILSGCAAIWAISSKSAKKRPWETTRSGGSHGNQGGGCKSKYTGHILHLMRWESRCLLQDIDTFFCQILAALLMLPCHPQTSRALV